MTTASPSRPGRLWVYSVLPAVILNVGAIIMFGSYYAIRSQRPALIAGIRPEQVQFLSYVFVFVVEWVFAISLLRQRRAAGSSLKALMAPDVNIWMFRWLPAIAVFIAFNALLAVYVPVVCLLYGAWPSLGGLAIWQRLFLAVAVPVQAAFCEELIWRGHVIRELQARGHKDSSAVLLSALSFALIHGIFLIDKLLLAFALGLVAGVYYVRERKLLPLMVSHFVADVWTFTLSVL